MNKKNWKNETKQQTRKRELRPVSRDSAATRRQFRAGPAIGPESGINFAVNVSSSGTNFNKKIEFELARLDSVEKKIRKHKCKATAVTTKSPMYGTNNQRKLRSILESMLATMDSVPPKPKKCAPYHQKMRFVENDYADAGRRNVKPKRVPPNAKMVDSFTNISINNNKRFFKSNTPRTDTVCVKSAMKKPMSAPDRNHNSFLADDLRFAESLRFGKKVDLQFTLSDLKKMAQSSNNSVRRGSGQEIAPQKTVKNVKFSNVTKNFKVIIEQPSKNNISYIYDSTSFDYMNAEGLSCDVPKLPNESIRTLRTVSSEKRVSRTEQIAHLAPNSEEVKTGSGQGKKKPEEKKFYSYLQRGNFTIAGRVDENSNGDGEGKVSDRETKVVNVRYCDELEEDSENADDREKSGKPEDEATQEQFFSTSPSFNDGTIKEVVPLREEGCRSHTFGLENIETYPDVCDFPTELLERSILAVEKVLDTIDSMANEFNTSTEITDPLFGEDEVLDTMDELLVDNSIDRFLNQLAEDGLVDSAYKGDAKLQNIPNGDQLLQSGKCSSEVNGKLFKESNESFSTSKPAVLCSGDSNSIHETTKNSPERAKGEMRSHIDIVCLKPPVKHFVNSEEHFPEIYTSQFSIPPEKSKERPKNSRKHQISVENEEDADPLMVALESLRTRVNAIEEEMVETSPKRTDFTPPCAVTTLSCTSENVREKGCPGRSGRRHLVKVPPKINTFFDNSYHSLATSQSENNVTINHSYSLSCSSDGSRTSSFRKYFFPPSSKMFPRHSNRIFGNWRNRRSGSFDEGFKESGRTERSKIFPDYYIDKCLKLLRKKFKDFDNARQKKFFRKNSIESFKSDAFEEFGNVGEMVKYRVDNEAKLKRERSFYGHTETLWINNIKENYKVCFKNENFNNQSETSIESCSRADGNVKKKNAYTIPRIKSSPR